MLRTPLIPPFLLFVPQAVCQNNVKTVKFLLDCGVDPNVRDLYGYTPLKNAEVLKNEEMIEILQSAMDATTSAVANQKRHFCYNAHNLRDKCGKTSVQS